MLALSRQILAVAFGVVVVVSLLISNGSAQETSGSGSRKNLPCVTASSPCPLDLTAMPDSLMPQVAEAMRLFERGDFATAQQVLEALRAAQPENRTILYDLALVSLKQGQRDRALAYQQQALQGVTHPYQRRALDELGQEILYGNGARDKTSLSLADVLPSPAATVNDAKVRASRNPAEEAETEIKSVCATTAQKQTQLMDSPSGVFDLAQCAEYEGRLEEADRLYNRYLGMAPEALDRDSVALRVIEIDTFKDFDSSSPQRNTYHAGVKALMTGRFNAANEAFMTLSAGGPGSRVGLLQAAMLALLAGRQPQAEKYLGSLLSEETNTDMRDYISQLLKTEGIDNEEFSAGIKEALKFIEEFDFVQAWEAIQKPLSIYPLSPAVNVLAAFIALNTNNYPAARRAMDNLWSQDQPVFFYASVKSPDQKRERAYRVQISPNEVVLAPVWAGAKMAELVQRMEEGKVTGPTATPGPESAVALAKSDITRLRSEGLELVMETSKGEWKIKPQVAFLEPREGWPARAFMNDYADLFSAYLGLANVEMGTESTDAADRWRMVGKIALAALAAYGQGGGGNLGWMHGTTKMVVAASASASAAIAAVNEYHLYQATMNNTVNRFLFRPLIASGGTVTFMVPEHSSQSPATADSAVKIQNGDELLVQYWKWPSKSEKESEGFVSLHFEKDQIRLQDTVPGGPSIVVSCKDIGNSLHAKETHTESRQGSLRTSSTLTPWTIESTYSLLMSGSRKKEDPVIELEFSSELRRAKVRAEIESSCGLTGLPKDVTIFVATPSGRQWKDMFHGKVHLYDEKTVSFPSCAEITGVQLENQQDKTYLTIRTNKTGKVGSAYGKRNSEHEIHLRMGDEQSALRIGSKLAADCGIPFEH